MILGKQYGGSLLVDDSVGGSPSGIVVDASELNGTTIIIRFQHHTLITAMASFVFL